MCLRVRQIDDKGEQNLIAPCLVIYLWIELISKPTAENHTEEEVGGVRSATGGHLTQISGINGFILLFDGKLDPILEFVSLEAGSSTLW